MSWYCLRLKRRLAQTLLVREEKVLIVAMESEDETQIATAVKDVIKNCIITRGVKVDDFAILILTMSSSTSEVSRLEKMLRFL